MDAKRPSSLGLSAGLRKNYRLLSIGLCGIRFSVKVFVALKIGVPPPRSMEAGTSETFFLEARGVTDIISSLWCFLIGEAKVL